MVNSALLLFTVIGYGILLYFLITFTISMGVTTDAYKETCCHYDSFRDTDACKGNIPQNYANLTGPSGTSTYLYCVKGPPDMRWAAIGLVFGSLAFAALAVCGLVLPNK